MKIYVSAEGFELSPELEKYATRKVIFMVRKLPRQVRVGADCTIRLARTAQATVCALELTVEGEVFVAKEATHHPYSALDIVVAHVERQLTDRVRQHRSRHDWRVP